MLATTLIVGDESRFVACADLAHFDPALVGASEFLREIAKVDALVAEVVDEQQRLVERELKIHDFCREFALRCDLTHASKFGARLVGARSRAVEIFHGGHTENLTVGLKRVVASA